MNLNIIINSIAMKKTFQFPFILFFIFTISFGQSKNELVFEILQKNNFIDVFIKSFNKIENTYNWHKLKNKNKLITIYDNFFTSSKIYDAKFNYFKDKLNVKFAKKSLKWFETPVGKILLAIDYDIIKNTMMHQTYFGNSSNDKKKNSGRLFSYIKKINECANISKTLYKIYKSYLKNLFYILNENLPTKSKESKNDLLKQIKQFENNGLKNINFFVNSSLHLLLKDLMYADLQKIVNFYLSPAGKWLTKTANNFLIKYYTNTFKEIKITFENSKF